ncbi:MAG: DUF1657 domain-containing protein [Symbiobacteriia bacterium]
MTVQSDIQKAVAAAESAKGTYAMFEQATDDKSAQQMFKEMKADMERHVQILNSRLGYVNSNNQLNQQAQQQQQAQAQQAQQQMHRH